MIFSFVASFYYALRGVHTSVCCVSLYDFSTKIPTPLQFSRIILLRTSTAFLKRRSTQGTLKKLRVLDCNFKTNQLPHYQVLFEDKCLYVSSSKCLCYFHRSCFAYFPGNSKSLFIGFVCGKAQGDGGMDQCFQDSRL